MPKPTSAADGAPVRIVFVTLDNHLASTIERVSAALKPAVPGLSVTLHAAASWQANPGLLERCRADIATADIIIVTMLFMEDHIQAVLPDLKARRASCDAMVGFMSAGEIIRLTRLGSLSMGGEKKGLMSLLNRLKGSRKKGASSGAGQMAMLRRLPKILRFIPGAAQDLRAYFLAMQYWMGGSDENVENMLRFLIARYASGPRSRLKGAVAWAEPVQYPDVGLYHPDLPGRIVSTAAQLPEPAQPIRGTVGILVMRSYLLAGNTKHYDGVIRALEARGLRTIVAFASGLDQRPAITQFMMKDGVAKVDALLSLVGFSLVGGPAYNDGDAAAEMLKQLDVPYISAQAVEFQSLDQWESSQRGLLPIEATMMLSIPEIDGATGSIVYGGRSDQANGEAGRDMSLHAERAQMLAARISRLISLRKRTAAERKLAIVLFGFPPNAGSVGTAAYLSVFESLYNTMKALAAEGYRIDVPDSVDALRERILGGNAAMFGAKANVHARISADDHVRRERHLREIERQWGPAPGRDQTSGNSILVLGASFGNLFVGVQPGFGYEGDPMRLLFEHSFSPTHAFSAFYRYLREDLAADAVLHFGTHGALEFMPGKQNALSEACWPDRLIGDLPNFYLYAANNPSEGAIAKRRSNATLISYLTPSVGQAGLYRGLLELKASVQSWRTLDVDEEHKRPGLATLIQSQAAQIDLAAAEPAWTDPMVEVAKLWTALLELEYTLIPNGLHVVGAPIPPDERKEMLTAIGEASGAPALPADAISALVDGAPERAVSRMAFGRDSEAELAKVRAVREIDALLSRDHELDGIKHALNGRFVPPSPSGDLIRTPAILPTGRNTHGFDPFRIPSAFAMIEGRKQVDRLIARHRVDGHALPQTVALVLWGTDNLKSEGGPIGQALALLGARPRFDGYGRLCGAELVPLAELGRPRIDVMLSISGIFRDLLPLQTKILAEAAYLAAAADEPNEQNFVRKHALEYQAAHGGDLETAALRVFSNVDGAYGSNVNHLIESGTWQDEDELAEVFTRRKCFAFGQDGQSHQQRDLMQAILKDVGLAYQNLESVELGVTTVDHYFDSLGGIARAVRKSSGAEVPVYIGDQTRGTEGKVRTLSEQVTLETRTRMLNPKWFEGILKHGYEGVRHIEAHVTNTVGWSATTGQVAPWVYQHITETYVLDEAMRLRLSTLNPTASAKIANRLLEAHQRRYWTPDDDTLSSLITASEQLEDRVEGIGVETAA
jgi:magnesium chelatase subunit H